jgi:hypothetical protein
LTGKKYATFEELFKKPPRFRELDVHTTNGHSLSVRLRALSAKEYDDLIAQHPPTAAQKSKGNLFNPDTYAPALLAKVFDTPKLTTDEARSLYESPDWSSGEIGFLFMECVKLCNEGVDVPFNKPA